MKACPIIVGGITVFIAIIIFVINSAVLSGNQAYIDAIDKNVVACYNKESFEKKRDGDLVFYSGNFNPSKAIDQDFGTEFPGSIIYSYVEEMRIEHHSDGHGDTGNDYNWRRSYKYLANIKPKTVQFKNTNITINTEDVVKYGSDFERVYLSEASAAEAHRSFNGKSKSISGGMLYYQYSSWSRREGDLRIAYYKLKNPDKLCVIGMKEKNEIIPAKNLPGYIGTEVFKSSGDNYTLNQFIDVLKNEGHTVYSVIKIIAIIAIVVAVILLLFGFKEEITCRKNNSSLLM